jgi:hypothetical protein
MNFENPMQTSEDLQKKQNEMRQSGEIGMRHDVNEGAVGMRPDLKQATDEVVEQAKEIAEKHILKPEELSPVADFLLKEGKITVKEVGDNFIIQSAFEQLTEDEQAKALGVEEIEQVEKFAA